jgi:hypothetical protein
MLPFHLLQTPPLPLPPREMRAVFVDLEGQPLAALMVL